MLVLTEITYCRDGQLICLAGHFEKAGFSGTVGTEFISPDVLFKTPKARTPKIHRGYL